MTNHIWHAGFISKVSPKAGPPVRTELIEAESEDEAAEVAKGHLGQCVSASIWRRPVCWKTKLPRYFRRGGWVRQTLRLH